MNWMLLPSTLFVIAGLLMFARPEWGMATRRLERKSRSTPVSGKMIDEAVMADMVTATALIILGGMGVFGFVGALDLLNP